LSWGGSQPLVVAAACASNEIIGLNDSLLNAMHMQCGRRPQRRWTVRARAVHRLLIIFMDMIIDHSH
jgi:hypothetical protein